MVYKGVMFRMWMAHFKDEFGYFSSPSAFRQPCRLWWLPRSSSLETWTSGSSVICQLEDLLLRVFKMKNIMKHVDQYVVSKKHVGFINVQQQTVLNQGACSISRLSPCHPPSTNQRSSHECACRSWWLTFPSAWWTSPVRLLLWLLCTMLWCMICYLAFMISNECWEMNTSYENNVKPSSIVLCVDSRTKILIESTPLVFKGHRHVITIFPLFVEPLWHPNLAIGFGTTKSPKLRFERVLFLS